MYSCTDRAIAVGVNEPARHTLITSAGGALNDQPVSSNLKLGEGTSKSRVTKNTNQRRIKMDKIRAEKENQLRLEVLKWEQKQVKCPQCSGGPANLLCLNCESRYVPDFIKTKPKTSTTQKNDVKFTKLTQSKGSKKNISLEWHWPSPTVVQRTWDPGGPLILPPQDIHTLSPSSKAKNFLRKKPTNQIEPQVKYNIYNF